MSLKEGVVWIFPSEIPVTNSLGFSRYAQQARAILIFYLVGVDNICQFIKSEFVFLFIIDVFSFPDFPQDGVVSVLHTAHLRSLHVPHTSLQPKFCVNNILQVLIVLRLSDLIIQHYIIEIHVDNT